MIENLESLIRDASGDAIVGNPLIASSQQQQATTLAAESIVQTLQDAIAVGERQIVLGLLSGETPGAAIPLVGAIARSFAQRLGLTLGLSSSAAMAVSATLIPRALESLIAKIADPNDAQFDLASIFEALSVGNSRGVKLSGLSADIASGREPSLASAIEKISTGINRSEPEPEASVFHAAGVFIRSVLRS